MLDEEFKKIPAVKIMNTHLRLLDALIELHSGELFAVIKLADVARLFSSKMKRKYSPLKVSSLIRELFGDHVIEKKKSRYFAVIYIATLQMLLRKYEPWRIE